MKREAPPAELWEATFGEGACRLLWSWLQEVFLQGWLRVVSISGVPEGLSQELLCLAAVWELDLGRIIFF